MEGPYYSISETGGFSYWIYAVARRLSNFTANHHRILNASNQIK